jgi:hypothetical protein
MDPDYRNNILKDRAREGKRIDAGFGDHLKSLQEYAQGDLEALKHAFLGDIRYFTDNPFGNTDQDIACMCSLFRAFDQLRKEYMSKGVK